MSISRLWVRISKCSRESLSLNGERITQYTFCSVGSGTGPATVAPVRVAVSTISFAAVSIAVWSYDFRRMRILFWAMVAMWRKKFRFFSVEWGAPGIVGPPHRCRICWKKLAAVRLARAAALYGLLLDDLGHDARADRTATLADREAEARVHGDRLDQLDRHLDVVTRHHHLRALGQVGDAGHVRRAEVELRPVAGEERRVTATLLLLQDVDLGLEMRVRRDRTRLAENLPALDLLALGTAQEATDVVAGTTLVEDLLEHLDAGDDGGGRVLDAHDLDGLAGLDDPLLDAARRDGAATG